MSRTLNLLWVIAFCLALAIVPASLVLGLGSMDDRAFRDSEQRPRAAVSLPGWSQPKLAEFFPSLDRFVADHLPYRREWLALKGHANHLFGAPLRPEAVIFGKDGWLFLGNAQGRGIDQYRGIVQLDAGNLAAFTSHIRGIGEALKAKGIPFVFVIAPDKHAIYPEQLPSRLSLKGRSPADQVVEALRGDFILDLRPMFIEEKARGPLPLYFKTDSHWNEYGAYLAYRNILARLPGVAPIAAESEDFQRLMQESGEGDIAVMAGGTQPFPDEYTHLRRDFFPGRLDAENLATGESRRVPAVQMTRVTDTRYLRVTNPGGQGTLLVLADSFTDNVTPYFNNTFATVVYQHYTEFRSEGILALVARHRPDAVVFMMAQRNLTRPVSMLIPLAPGDRAQAPAAAATAAAATAPASPRAADPSAIGIANDRLIAESPLVREIVDVRMAEGDLVFRATGHDPYFQLPQLPRMPRGAQIRIELTLPGERLVQLYYQTVARGGIAEEDSVKKALPAGRHTVDWQIAAPLDGVLRLDPGNAPGEYRIHRIEIRP